MSDGNKEKIPSPEIGPFVFPALLAIFGLWCAYDGWFSSNPGMQDHLLLNRLGSLILLPWAAVDFFRTWRTNQADRLSEAQHETGQEEDS